jgi:hypothetical protein
MKTLFCIIMAIVMLSGCAHGVKWDAHEKIVASTILSLQVIDISQTRDHLASGGTDHNPLFSSGNEIPVGVAQAGAVWFVADKFDHTWRKALLYVVGMVKIACISINYDHGARP